jgi:hypothetical protein
VREHGDGPRRLAERALVVLEGEAVEAVADRRRQERVAPTHLGDPVRVLDDSDRLPLRIAAHVHLVLGDRGSGLRQQPLRAYLLARVDAVPAAVGEQDEEEDGGRGDDHDALQPRPQRLRRPRPQRRRLQRRLAAAHPLARLLDQLVELLVAQPRGREPDVAAVDLDEHRLEPRVAAEVAEVDVLRRAPAPGSRPRPLPQARHEEVHLERDDAEERQPDRDHVLELRQEEPRQDRDQSRDAQAARLRHQRPRVARVWSASAT